MPIILCSVDQPSKYLAHYRTKGSKNGVRRWQNKDGSYTPEGYQHYAEMYGWGKRKQENVEDNSKHILSRITEIDNSDQYKKVIDARNKIQELRDEQISASDKYEVSNEEWWKRYQEIEDKISNEWKRIEQSERKLGITSGSNTFMQEMFRATEDKKLCTELSDKLKDDPDFVSLRKKVQEHDEQEEKQSILFRELLSKYEKKHGEEFTGDGTEAHELLVSEFKGYKKLHDKVEKLNMDIIKLSEKIARKPTVQSVKRLNRYIKFYDRIVDPNTGVPWYRIGNITPMVIASSAGANDSYIYLYGDRVVVPYYNNGKPIPGAYRGL